MEGESFPPLRWQDVAMRRAGTGIGDPFIYRPSVDSTNSLAASLVAEGIAPGAVVFSDHQTHGRGRLQRTWLAAPGSSLTFTVVIAAPARAWAVPMTTGLALVEALAAHGLAADLKWPNDVLIAGKKCAGVLIETKRVLSDYRLLVGIGLNVRMADPTLPNATFLDSHARTAVVREELLVDLLDSLERWYQRATGDPDAVRVAWRARLITLGTRVTVHGSEGRYEGLAEDIGPDGALVLRMADGSRRTVGAGDVSLAGPITRMG